VQLCRVERSLPLVPPRQPSLPPRACVLNLQNLHLQSAAMRRSSRISRRAEIRLECVDTDR